MNYSKIQSAARLLIAGACLITARSNQGAEFWLRAGSTNLTMPDGRVVAVWGFARDSAAGAGDGAITVPGPQLDVPAGDSLTIHLSNTLPEPVSIVVPGQYNYDSLDTTLHAGGPYDGRVRSLTREAVAGGPAVDYTWASVTNGTFLYHSGSHPAVQVQMGLYGALVVVSAGPQAYPGVSFSSSATLLFSEIDPEVHDAVGAGSFGPGPAFMESDFTDATAATLVGDIQTAAAGGDPVAQFVADALVSGTTAADVVADLNTLVLGSSIFALEVFPDESILSLETLDLLMAAPELNQPTVDAPLVGEMVRLNRMLLFDGLAAAGVAIPNVKQMTSTIRSYPQYFLVNGQPYTNNQPPIAVGAAGSPILLRFLNVAMDAHVPTLNNGGDLQLLSEDGQLAPYVRRSTVIWMPALKTVDALWTPAAAGVYTIYDRRLGLVNGVQSPGGLVVKLSVTGPVATPSPVILVQPANQTIPEFGTAAFRVVASGSGLTYQWQRLQSGVTYTNIPGATAATYARANITPIASFNGALFRVIVSGTGGGPVTSSSALLTVLPAPPVITTQPATHNVTPPAQTTFSVVATGTTPFTYQWYKAALVGGPYTALVNGGGYSGTTARILTNNPSSAASAGFYQVVVTGPGGSATSLPAELRIAPAIVTQPANQTVPDLTTATFSVVATGSSLTYQWQRQGTGGGFANIANETNSSYSILAHYLTDNGAVFRVRVDGSVGGIINSANATLTVTPVNSAPVITLQPLDVETNAGARVDFLAAAYGYPAPTNIWQRWNGEAWQSLSGSFATGFTGPTTGDLRANNVTVARAGSFQVVYRNSQGSVTSRVATLTVSQTFAGTPISIPLAGGTASPYPATTAAVPGLTGAEVRHVTVSMLFSSDEPFDVDAMLVAPGNLASARKSVFMSGLGARPTEITDITNPELGLAHQYPVTNINLTFDDNAPAPVSPFYWLAGGTYQPSINPINLPLVPWPAPAPGLPYPMTFGAFNALVTPNGQWRLYVNDTQNVDLAPPVGGNGKMNPWSLTLTVGPMGGPPPPPLPLAAPQTPTQIAPGDAGVGTLVNTFTPTYTFSMVDGATQYKIQVTAIATDHITEYPWVPAASVDPGHTGIGSITQPTPLAPGTYSWVVVAGNAAGISHFPAGLAFATPNAGAASPVQPVSPSGTIGTRTPTYRFNLVPEALGYQVQVTSVATGVSTVLGPFQTVAGGGTVPSTGTYSVAQPTPLASGNYSWIVQTEMAGGWVWSNPMNFRVP